MERSDKPAHIVPPDRLMKTSIALHVLVVVPHPGVVGVVLVVLVFTLVLVLVGLLVVLKVLCGNQPAYHVI